MKLLLTIALMLVGLSAFGQSKAIHELDEKTTPADADMFVIDDGAANWRVPYSSIRPTLNATNVTFDLWVDALSPLTAGKVPNANAPTMTTMYGMLQAYQFSQNASNAIFLTVQLPHGVKRVTNNVHPHVHWTAATPATNIVWGFEYMQANGLGVLTNSYGTLYATGTCTAAFRHTLTSFGYINATGTTNSDSQIIVGKLFRIDDDVNVDVFGLSFDPHVLLTLPGSTAEIPD